MAIQTDAYLCSKFVTGNIPTQQDFFDLIDSRAGIYEGYDHNCDVRFKIQQAFANACYCTRGEGSVDFSTFRSANTHVAQGCFSNLIGSWASGIDSASCKSSIITSTGASIVESNNSLILNGINSVINASNCAYLIGNANIFSSPRSYVYGKGGASLAVVCSSPNSTVFGSGSICSSSDANIFGQGSITNASNESFILSPIGGGISCSSNSSLMSSGGTICCSNVASIVAGNTVSIVCSDSAMAVASIDSSICCSACSLMIGTRTSNIICSNGAILIGSTGSDICSSSGSMVIGNIDILSCTDKFLAKFVNGYSLYTDSGETAGVNINAGGGSWSSISDKNKKENYEQVDHNDILERIARMPVEKWQYIAEESKSKHIGPYAQDFKLLFGLGDSDKTISTIDADGVLFSGIKGLYNKVKKLESCVDELSSTVHILKNS